MNEKKLFGRFCPKCGKVCQTHDAAAVSLGAGVQYNMSCEDGHKWSEFYCLTYTGFWWDGKRYDSYGEEIKND
jgi:hypothetical protein